MNTPRTSPVVGRSNKISPRENRRHTLHRMLKEFGYLNLDSREVFVSSEAMDIITFDQLFVLAELKQDFGYKLRLRAVPFMPEETNPLVVKAREFAQVEKRDIFVSNEAMNAITFDQLFILAELNKEFGYKLHLRSIHPKNT